MFLYAVSFELAALSQ